MVFLILSGRPTCRRTPVVMNSVLEVLRQWRLHDMPSKDFVNHLVLTAIGVEKEHGMGRRIRVLKYAQWRVYL